MEIGNNRTLLLLVDISNFLLLFLFNTILLIIIIQQYLLFLPSSFQTPRSGGLITPHGGSLVNTMITDAKEKEALVAKCGHTQELSDRNACDVELLAIGGFSP